MDAFGSQRVGNVIQARDKRGRRFYYHCESQVSHWFQPRLQAVAPGTPGSRSVSRLPAEAVVLWAEKRDRKHRKVYLNLMTGAASKNRPSSHSMVDCGQAALLEVADTVGPEAVAERPSVSSDASALRAGEGTTEAPAEEKTGQLSQQLTTVPETGAEGSSETESDQQTAGGSVDGQQLSEHNGMASAKKAGPRVGFAQVLIAPTGNTSTHDKPPSPAARPSTAAKQLAPSRVQPSTAAAGLSAPPGQNGAPRRPRTPPLADAVPVYGEEAATVAPSAVMPLLNRSSLRLPRERQARSEAAIPAHVAAKLAQAAQQRQPTLLEERKASRQRRLTFNPFSAVTALPGHGHRDEAAAVKDALRQQQLLRPAQHGAREHSVEDASDAGSSGMPSPTSRYAPPPPPSRGPIGSHQEASDAGEILFKEGIRMHSSGRLQRGDDRYAVVSSGAAPPAAAASPRTVAREIVARHAHSSAPAWATAAPAHEEAAAAVAPSSAPALPPLPSPSEEHPLSPLGGDGGAWSWDAGSTVLDTTSLWDGTASEAWTDAEGAADAIGAGGIGSALPRSSGPVSAAAAAGRRLTGSLVNVHALVEAAAEGQVVWVETIDQVDGRAAAVPFVKSGGAILQGDAVKRPDQTLGAPGAEGGSALPQQQHTHGKQRSGRISLVQWTGYSAKRLASTPPPSGQQAPPPTATAAAAAQRQLDRGRVIEAITHGELRPIDEPAQLATVPEGAANGDASQSTSQGGLASGDGGGRFANLRVHTHDTESDHDDSGDDYSLRSGGTSTSWMPPAPGPLYVVGRPLTSADLNSLYGGGSVDVNLVSGSGPPVMPPTRSTVAHYYHEELPASRDSSGSPGSREALSPTLASMTPRTQGRFETWTRKAATPKASQDIIVAAAASDYQLASSKRPSFAVQALQVKRAARQSNPGARSGFGPVAEGQDEQDGDSVRRVAEVASSLTPASIAADGFVPEGGGSRPPPPPGRPPRN